jgi:uncharacterized protein (TIGR02284 family)
MKTTVRNDNEVLNELLNINNDRAEGYHKASEDTCELDLKTVFNDMADESMKNASALLRRIKQSGGITVVHISTVTGKVYRVCRDVRAKFTGKGRQSILDCCKIEEDVAEAAYLYAISSNDLTTEVRQMVRNQQAGMTISFNIIKNYRHDNRFSFAGMFLN